MKILPECFDISTEPAKIHFKSGPFGHVEKL
jgi:hypothetical protein